MKSTQDWITKKEWRGLYEQFSARPLRSTTLLLLAFDLGLLALSWFLWSTRGRWSAVIAWPLLMLALIHLYLILHEAAHSSVSRHVRVNHLVGNLCGWTFLLPFFTRQRNHLLHHVWAGHPLGDPENNKMIARFSVMTAKQARKLELIWRNWLPLITLNHFVDHWRDPVRQLRAGNRSPRIAREVRFAAIYLFGYLLVASVLVATGNVASFLTWYLPPWIVLLAFVELVNLPHHAEAPLLDPESKALPYWQQAKVSHSCASVPIWSRFVILNFNRHVAHHAFPMVPWYDLPLLDDLANQRTGAIPRTVKNEFHWSATNRRRPLLSVMGHFFDKRGKPYCPLRRFATSTRFSSGS